MNQTRSLINRSAIREYTMAVLAETRPHLVQKFTRVSREYYEVIEGQLRDAIRRSILTCPTSGKTIRSL